MSQLLSLHHRLVVRIVMSWFMLLLACVASASAARANAPAGNPPHVASAGHVADLSRFQRAVFTARDGMPAGVWAMTQDRDGYLWLGGSTGLFRFDGQHFEAMFKSRLPSGMITALYGDADGNLWIGTLHGQVTRVHDGIIESVHGGLAEATVMSFHQMAGGALWIVTSSKVAQLMDGSWHRADAAQGFDAEQINVAGTGRDGSYWVFAADAAYRLSPGAKRFERYSRDAGMAAMADLPPGVAYPDSGVTADMVVDRYGALWVPTNGKLVRLHAQQDSPTQQAITEAVKPLDHEGDIQVMADFSDRDGNVWIVTSAGLEQFRPTRFVPLTLPQLVYRPTLAIDHDGDLWIASNSATPPMRLGSTITLHPELGAHIACITTGADGSVWLSGDKGIRRYLHDVVSTIPVPGADSPEAAQGNAGRSCNGMGVASDGSLWLSNGRAGVSRWDGQRWIKVLDDMASTIEFAGEQTWAGFADGSLTSIGDGKTTTYTSKDGLGVGSLLGLFSGKSGLWITGADGVMLKVGKHFRRLSGIRGERFENVSDIVELDNGDLWMVSPAGVYRVPASEIRLALATPGHAVSYQKFDQADGLQGAIGSRQADPLEVGSDGRLWVASERGVAWIDPGNIAPAPAPPPVSIESLNGRDVRFARIPEQNLEKGTRSMAITFTAATLSTPTQARFRYLLKGVDDDWQESAGRRDAHYSNLGPGHYTFQVEASNADGVWARQPSSLSFRILPAFYQTWWFKLLCIAVLLLGMWLLYLLRVAHICAQLDARARERESMARDFHDTILQSFHGLLLHVEAAAQSIPENTARQKLDKALSVTTDALIEGREKIGQLRSLTEPLEELSTDITRLADLFGSIHPIAFSMHVDGAQQPLNASAANDVHAIVRELVINAFRHSQASTLHVALHYGRPELTITVTDDGCGLDASALVAREPGHWGLQGMQERARQIGGRLTFGVTPSGRGTRAVLKIPARFIYAGRRWFH
jgi:ligand-binding sensor domain-containing protein/two-component sensor histidine kinase